MPNIPHLNHNLTYTPNTESVLYLHGFLGCLDDWREITDGLGGTFSHLTVDLPGHRMRADKLGEEQYTMPGCAKLVMDLLDNLQIEQTHLVAYSMGGRLGLYLLTHYPQRFIRAVIESASPGLRTESERTARREYEHQLIEQLRNRPLDQFLREWYDQPLFQSMKKSDPRFALMLERRSAHDSEALALLLKQMGTSVQPSLWDKLGDIHLPVMFIAGANDNKYFHQAESMTNLCSAGQSTIILETGHNTHWERPEEFCRLVRSFLIGQK